MNHFSILLFSAKPNAFRFRIFGKTMHRILFIYFLLLGIIPCQAQINFLKLVEEKEHKTANEKLDTNKEYTQLQVLSDSIAENNLKQLVDKQFWNKLLKRSLNWMLTKLPSIAFLIFIFIALLRFLTFIVARLKKMSTHHHSNINDHERIKRIETLSGIILSVGKIFLWTIFILTLLSKFDLNIAPVLASAGIVGLAVGFGAQELVRDFISGFFILLEDQIRTGDVAIINGTTGTVEKIEMRTTTLRDVSGIVHIFQNGKINSMSNMTKGWSAIIVDIGVAYKEDTDTVNEVLKQIGDEMMADKDWKDQMLAVTLLGLDSFGDSAVVLKVKLTTKSGEQWGISREFRRRVKKVFDAQGIEIPFPHLSIYTGEVTKPMPIALEGKEVADPEK